MAARDLGPRKRATEAWLSPAESQEPQLEKGVLPESNHWDWRSFVIAQSQAGGSMGPFKRDSIILQRCEPGQKNSLLRRTELCIHCPK